MKLLNYIKQIDQIRNDKELPTFFMENLRSRQEMVINQIKLTEDQSELLQIIKRLNLKFEPIGVSNIKRFNNIVKKIVGDKL